MIPYHGDGTSFAQCGYAKFTNIVRIQADASCGTCSNPPCPYFSQGGDSGAAIVRKGSNQIVGLLFASDGASNTYANHISDVLTELGVTIDPTSSHCSWGSPTW